MLDQPPSEWDLWHVRGSVRNVREGFPWRSPTKWNVLISLSSLPSQRNPSCRFLCHCVSKRTRVPRRNSGDQNPSLYISHTPLFVCFGCNWNHGAGPHVPAEAPQSWTTVPQQLPPLFLSSYCRFFPLHPLVHSLTTPNTCTRTRRVTNENVPKAADQLLTLRRWSLWTPPLHQSIISIITAVTVSLIYCRTRKAAPLMLTVEVN